MTRVLLLALLVLGAHRAPAANACTCGVPDPPRVALERNAAVFAGRVVEIREPVGPWGQHLTLTFAVAAVWKGEVGDTVLVSTPPDDATCGYPFALCEEYLVYAYAFDDGVAQAGLCGRTAPLGQADADLADLGEPGVTWATPQAPGCGTFAPLLGRWRADGMAPHVEWDVMEFRAGGTCITNAHYPGGSSVVAAFPYAVARTLVSSQRTEQKVAVGDSQWLYVNPGNGWQRSDSAWQPAAFFGISENGELVAYPLGELDWWEWGVPFERTDEDLLSVGPGGAITRVRPRSWADVKAGDPTGAGRSPCCR